MLGVVDPEKTVPYLGAFARFMRSSLRSLTSIYSPVGSVRVILGAASVQCGSLGFVRVWLTLKQCAVGEPAPCSGKSECSLQ